MSGRRCWVVGYDIASPRRLRRVAKLLERQAVRVQYSVFVGSWTELEFDALWSAVAREIHPRADDVRAWPVPLVPWVACLGKTAGAEGIFFAERGAGSIVETLGGPKRAARHRRR